MAGSGCPPCRCRSTRRATGGHSVREYDKQARQCAAEGVDHVRYLVRLTELELIDRERRMVERRIRMAKFPAVKSLHSFDLQSGSAIAWRQDDGSGSWHRVGLRIRPERCARKTPGCARPWRHRRPVSARPGQNPLSPRRRSVLAASPDQKEAVTVGFITELRRLWSTSSSRPGTRRSALLNTRSSTSS